MAPSVRRAATHDRQAPAGLVAGHRACLRAQGSQMICAAPGATRHLHGTDVGRVHRTELIERLHVGMQVVAAGQEFIGRLP